MSKTPSPFDVVAFGIVLKVAKLRECVDFYHEVLELPIWFREDSKVCLRMGDAYLMLEVDPKPDDTQANPVLRFSVPDVAIAAGQLSMRGVTVALRQTGDGAIAVFDDPDGNHCEVVVGEAGFSA